MGRIERLKAITGKRIEAFLASLETPETVMPQLIREMAGKVCESTRAETKALTAVKADRRRLDAANGRVNRLLDGAKLALQADEPETARQAIAAQIEAEREVERCGESLATSEAAYESARQVREQLQGQLQELKSKGQDILTRVRLLRQQQEPLRSGPLRPGARAGGILEMVARMEMQVEEEEATLEIRDRISHTLGVTFQHERVVELENDAEVDRRLEVLRREMGATER